jgi:hypothetical protein
MGFDSKGLDDYIDVAQRIAEFRSKHPEGSLQPLNPAQPFEVRELGGTGKDGKEVRGTFIIYVAAAYRSPDDQRPGIGCAYEVFPGRTPYTAGSELQNAETAAWGRAIVAALAADTRAGIASQQEVRNRQAERGDQASGQNGSNGNGQQQRGQVSRPAQSRAPAQPPAGIDEKTVADWAAKIDEIAGDEDADRAEDELREVRGSGRMDARTADAIRKAIRAKRDAVTQRETAAVA